MNVDAAPRIEAEVEVAAHTNGAVVAARTARSPLRRR